MKEKSKFKKGLVNDIRAELIYENKQEDLKEKYNIKGDAAKDVVVVEKDHLAVDFLKTFLNVVIYILACIGLTTVIYPGLRAELISMFSSVLSQIQSFLPF